MPLTRPGVPVLAVQAVLAGLLALALVAGCSSGPDGQDAPGGGQEGSSVALAASTCWTADSLGADPQAVLALSRTYAVDYFAAAHAVDGRPAFTLTEACGGAHHVEVYRVVALDQVKPVVKSYAAFLRHGRPAYAALDAAVRRACMNEPLAAVAKQTGVPGAVVQPVFPDGVELGWAPPSPQQWDKGQRVYACTLSSPTPVRYRYASVFTKDFPTGLRTCISNSPLLFVDCARKHERERIATIEVRTAVGSKKFPGRSAITDGPDGRFVDVPRARLAALDRACTAYLRAVSTTTRYTGVAELDADRWPAPDGSYPVDCEADTPPTEDPVTSEGTVFNK